MHRLSLAEQPGHPNQELSVRYGSLADIGATDQGGPLYSQKQTYSSLSAPMSALCHKRTSRLSCLLNRWSTRDWQFHT